MEVGGAERKTWLAARKPKDLHSAGRLAEQFVGSRARHGETQRDWPRLGTQRGATQGCPRSRTLVNANQG